MIRDKNAFFFSLRLGLAENGNNFFDVHMRIFIEASDLFKSGASDNNDLLVC